MPEIKVHHHLPNDKYNNGLTYVIDICWIVKPAGLKNFPPGLEISYECKEGVFSAKIESGKSALEEEQSSSDDEVPLKRPKDTQSNSIAAIRSKAVKTRLLKSNQVKPKLKILSISQSARVDISTAENSESRVDRSPMKVHQSLLEDVSEKIRQYAIRDSISSFTQTDECHDVDMRLNFDNLASLMTKLINDQFAVLTKNLDNRFRELQRGHITTQLLKTVNTNPNIQILMTQSS